MAPSRSRTVGARSRGHGRSRGAGRRGRQNALVSHLKELSEAELILNGLLPETLARMKRHSQSASRGRARSKRGISRATLNQVAKGLLSNVSSGSDNDQMSLDESLTYSDTGCAGDSRSGCCDSEPKSPSVLGCSDIGSNSPDYGYAANESHDDMDLLPTIPWFVGIKDKEYDEHDAIEEMFEQTGESLLPVDQERSMDITSTLDLKPALVPSLINAVEEKVSHEVEDNQKKNENYRQDVENYQQKEEKMEERSEPIQVDLAPEDLMEVVRSQVPSMPPELLQRLEDVLQKNCPLKDMVQTFARITQPMRKRNNKITSYFPKVNRPIDEKTNNGTKRESTMNNVTEDGAAHAGLHGMELLAKSCLYPASPTSPSDPGERASWDVAGTSHDVTVPGLDDDMDLHSDVSSPRVPTLQSDDDDLESLFPSITFSQKVSPDTKRIKTESNSSELQARMSKRGRDKAWRRGRRRARGFRRRSDDVADDNAHQHLFSSTLNELLSAASTPPPRDLPTPRGPTETNQGEDEEEEMGVAETYADYVPAKLKIGRHHPDPVVETSSLSSVDIADITYQLRLPEDTIEEGMLSALQLEAIVYASQAHEHVLPDGMRAGFLVGDGAGVGKGRTIAGIIFENYLAGRKRAVWVSVSNDLKYDAERDLRDIGAGDKIQVRAINKLNYHSISSAKQVTGPVTEGVVFSTYSALIGHTSAAGAEYRKRLDQLVAWCGPDFEGCIVFDESHRAKNLCPTTATNPTETGKAVLQLQLSLPKARVIYASATGASEPRNMAYMVRLGLWGEGTPFHTFKDFLNAVEKRGVGAMEIVAMDMKLRGMYIARQLSFHGVTFKIEEVPLSQLFQDTYDKAVELWVKAKKDFEVAVDMVDASKKWRRVMWAQFWGAHQRFFKYLCIAAKVSRVVQCTKDAVNEGKCVVVGLQSTGEARTLDQLERDRGQLHQFICTAKGVFTSLVEKQFPCPNNMVEPEDYAEGFPSFAVEESTNDMRERLLEDIAVLGGRLPPNTLDQLIDLLDGPEKVAEMTGRKGRVVQTETGKIKYESRIEADVPLETINLTEKQRFMDGEKDVAIISEAASSGISLQSDRRVKNQKRRVHITLELPWSADRAIQQFGRTHRSNQVNAPEYVFLISDLAGERRFASTVAKRLESLGALTHGDRRATETRDLSQFNIENKHGRAALRCMLQVIYGSAPPLPSVVPSAAYLGDFLKDAAAALADVGLEIGPEGSTSNIPRFLNRLLGVKVQLQNALFHYFSDTFDAVVREAKRSGRFDLGILDLGAAGQCVRRVGRVRFLRTHATGQAPVELHTLHVERGFEWEKAVKKLSERGDPGPARVDPDEGFYLSRQRFSNNYNAILCIAHSTNRDHVGRNRLFSVYRPNLGLSVRPELLSDLVNKYAKCPAHAAAPAWRAHYLHSLNTCSHAWWHGHCGNVGCEVGMRTRTYHVLSGSVLAVWALLEAVYKRLHLVNKMQVVRIKTDQGLKIVGTIIPKYCVDLLKEELRNGAVSVEEDNVST